MNFLNILLKAAPSNRPKEIASKEGKSSKASFEDFLKKAVVVSKDEKKYLEKVNNRVIATNRKVILSNHTKKAKATEKSDSKNIDKKLITKNDTSLKNSIFNSKEKDIDNSKNITKSNLNKKRDQNSIDKNHIGYLDDFAKASLQKSSLKSQNRNEKDYLKNTKNRADLNLKNKTLQNLNKEQKEFLEKSSKDQKYLNSRLHLSQKNDNNLYKNIKNLQSKSQVTGSGEKFDANLHIENFSKKLEHKKNSAINRHNSHLVLSDKKENKYMHKNFFDNIDDNNEYSVKKQNIYIEKNDIKEHLFQNEQRGSQNSPAFEKSLNNKDLFKDSNQNFHTASNAQLSNGSERDSFSQSQNSNDSKNFNSNQTNFEHNIPDKQKNSFLFKVNDVIINATLKNHFLTLSLASNNTILLTNGLENEIKSILKSSGFKDFNLTIKDREKKVYLDSSKNSIQKRDKSKIYVLA